VCVLGTVRPACATPNAVESVVSVLHRVVMMFVSAIVGATAADQGVVEGGVCTVAWGSCSDGHDED
jgi:hypothetical protein